MKEWAERFYKSKAWQKCRDAYASSRWYLCEMCLKEGRTTPGEIVHHRIELTPNNINDPSVTLDWSNLMLLCRDHHAQVHEKYPKRFKIDELGRVICK